MEVIIEAVDANGDGIARVGRQDVRVPFTIPGERVRIRLDGPGPLASVVSIVSPSPHRVTPRCPHFGSCGGCAWQHIAYPEQLRLKTALVERLIRAAVPRAPAVRPTLPGTQQDIPWGYRQKVHFVFGTAGGRSRHDALTMGHYARGSRRVVPVRECPVHDPRGNDAAFALFAALDAAHVTAASPGGDRGSRSRGGGVLRSVAVRVGIQTGELMTTLVVASDTDKALRAATRRTLTSPHAPTSLHVNLHPKQDAYIFGRDTRRITGPARLREEVAGTSFLMSPTAFFQTNVRAAAILVDLVRAAVPEHSNVLDLYAGAGLFALPLAKAGHRVVAVEENRDAVADGEAAQRLNRVADDRCRFIARPVEAVLRHLDEADVVVLDPPRDGCSPAVLDELCHRLRPARVIYVSCNPEALARDLGPMTAARYIITAVQPVDMFPHTAHVETVVVMDRRER